MSFILDALKKSENERQRQVGPSLADVQVRQRRNNKPWWVVAVAALLVLNLGVLLVVLMRDGDAKSSAPPAQRESTAPATSDAHAGTQVPLPASASRMPRGNPAPLASTDPAVHPLADEAGSADPSLATVVDPQLSAAGNVPDGPPMVRPIQAPAVAAATVPAQAAAQTAEDQEVLFQRQARVHADDAVHALDPVVGPDALHELVERQQPFRRRDRPRTGHGDQDR